MAALRLPPFGANSEMMSASQMQAVDYELVLEEEFDAL